MRKVTIEDVRGELKCIKDCIANRNERIANCETSIEDCFVSINHDDAAVEVCEDKNDAAVEVCEDKIRILENGGRWTFVGYVDEEGNFLEHYWFKNKYGVYSCRYTNIKKGIVIYSTATTAKGLAKKGIKEVKYTAPAWAKISSKSLYDTATSRIYEAEYNRLTGEIEERIFVE